MLTTAWVFSDDRLLAKRVLRVRPAARGDLRRVGPVAVDGVAGCGPAAFSRRSRQRVVCFVPRLVSHRTGSPRHDPSRAWRALIRGNCSGSRRARMAASKASNRLSICAACGGPGPGGRPGCHRRAQGLQGAERVLDPARLSSPGALLSQRIQLLGQVVRAGLQVGPSAPAPPAVGLPGASAMRSPSASAWPSMGVDHRGAPVRPGGGTPTGGARDPYDRADDDERAEHDP